MDLISIIVPVYGVEAYLDQCINGIWSRSVYRGMYRIINKSEL